jgi:hypothetical protein
MCFRTLEPNILLYRVIFGVFPITVCGDLRCTSTYLQWEKRRWGLGTRLQSSERFMEDISNEVIVVSLVSSTNKHLVGFRKMGGVQIIQGKWMTGWPWLFWYWNDLMVTSGPPGLTKPAMDCTWEAVGFLLVSDVHDLGAVMVVSARMDDYSIAKYGIMSPVNRWINIRT